jgi:ankyrin repeat protein
MSNGNWRDLFPKTPPSQAAIDLYVAAAEKGDDAAVRTFLNRHGAAHVDRKNSDGHTALCMAADKGRKTTVELLLSSGAQVDARDKHGWSPLHHAASSGHTGIAALLLGKGAQMEALTKDGFTPLMWAVRFDHMETTTLLLEKGANLNVIGAAGQTLQILAGGSSKMAELIGQWPETVRRRAEAARKAKEQEAAAAKEKEIRKSENERLERLKGRRPPKPPFKGKKP